VRFDERDAGGGSYEPGTYRVPGPPRAILMAAGAMIVLTIVLAAIGHAQHRTYIADGEVTAIMTRPLRFVDASSGAVDVYDARSNGLVASLPPATNGFVRGTMRSLARQRHLRDVSADVPFYLTRWQSGTVTLDDSSTGSHVVLNAFGPDNLAAFARFLPPVSAVVSPSRHAPFAP
jgi:putative photosynthetic complex assembly protein